jgi:putative ABC transport system ATP-binding protein
MAALNKRQEEKIKMGILEVRELSKIYGKGGVSVKALDSVSFDVQKGEFVAIIGASGSGKSTLLHMLGGVDRPTSGAVTVDGTALGQMNESQLAIFRRRNIGIIYQFYNLIPTLTVTENIMLPFLLDGRVADKGKLDDILRAIGLTDRANHLPSELSGGQQQRVSAGRALINSPAVILADEPTGNLDSRSGAEVIELLKAANRTFNQTLVIITHDEKIALQADRIITLEDGRIVRNEGVRS